MTDWKLHWNTKITKLDPNNWWIPQMLTEDFRQGYKIGYQDGYDHGSDSAIEVWNSSIDSIISDLEDLKT